MKTRHSIPAALAAVAAAAVLLTACSGNSAPMNPTSSPASSTLSPDKQAEKDYQALSLVMDTLVTDTSRDTPTMSTIDLDEIKAIAVANTKDDITLAAAIARDLNFIMGAPEHGPRAYVLADNGNGWWALTAAVPNSTRPYALCLRIGDIPNGGGARTSGFVYTPPLKQGSCAASDG